MFIPCLLTQPCLKYPLIISSVWLNSLMYNNYNNNLANLIDNLNWTCPTKIIVQVQFSYSLNYRIMFEMVSIICNTIILNTLVKGYRKILRKNLFSKWVLFVKMGKFITFSQNTDFYRNLFNDFFPVQVFESPKYIYNIQDIYTITTHFNTRY